MLSYTSCLDPSNRYQIPSKVRLSRSRTDTIFTHVGLERSSALLLMRYHFCNDYFGVNRPMAPLKTRARDLSDDASLPNPTDT